MLQLGWDWARTILYVEEGARVVPICLTKICPTVQQRTDSTKPINIGHWPVNNTISQDKINEEQVLDEQKPGPQLPGVGRQPPAVGGSERQSGGTCPTHTRLAGNRRQKHQRCIGPNCPQTQPPGSASPKSIGAWECGSLQGTVAWGHTSEERRWERGELTQAPRRGGG